MITFNFPIKYKGKTVDYSIGLVTDDPVDLNLQSQINTLNTPMGSIPLLSNTYGVPVHMRDIVGKESYDAILTLIAPDIDKLPSSFKEPIDG